MVRALCEVFNHQAKRDKIYKLSLFRFIMKRGLSIWDILAWIALASIVLWITLKILGIINTPLWLEYAPVYSASYVAGWMMHKLKIVHEEIHDLKNFKNETIKQIHSIKEDCAKSCK